MPIIDTSLLRPDEGNLQIYGALDAAVTLEVHEALTRLRNEPSVVYNFELGLQGPVLDMALRGFAVDPWARQRGMAQLEGQLRATDSVLQELAIAFWGKTLNARSSAQLKDFFYSKMNLPEQKAIIQGKWKVSCNRECLEKLEVFIHARPFVSLILDYRDTAKRLEVLRTEVDPDGRMRTAYNIAGTKTGRWSSSASALGTGGNLQNITPDLRGVFVSDPAFRLVGIDLEQAESREVGWQCGVIFGDWTYLDACEGGDLHTTVCKLTWPDLQWSGIPADDRRIAETPFYRHLTYRDMAKKLGHGSNYGGQPYTLARHAKIPEALAKDFQGRYFAAFPAIQRWHKWVAQELQTSGVLTTPFGRERRFFGRPNDPATLREAIAYVPQSSTGDRMNLGLWRIWRHMPEVQLLAQVHDAVYFQVPEGADLSATIKKALCHIDIPISGPGRSYSVPGEVKVGWNWGKYSESNPNGLKKWTGEDSRTRMAPLTVADQTF